MWVRLPMPEDMNELAGRWNLGMRDRVHAIAEAAAPMLDSAPDERPQWDPRARRPPRVSPVRPGFILATALNYPAHGVEMTTGLAAEMSDASALDETAAVSMDSLWSPGTGGPAAKPPTCFLKPGSIAIGHGEAIQMKPEREQSTGSVNSRWSSALRRATRRLAGGGRHIFGYTMMNDRR